MPATGLCRVSAYTTHKFTCRTKETLITSTFANSSLAGSHVAAFHFYIVRNIV